MIVPLKLPYYRTICMLTCAVSAGPDILISSSNYMCFYQLGRLDVFMRHGLATKNETGLQREKDEKSHLPFICVHTHTHTHQLVSRI